MTRRQKSILLILGILDIAVITLLASVVLRNLPPAPNVSPINVQASPCEQQLVAALTDPPPFAEGIPRVAWNDQQLDIALQVRPSTDSPQHLWTVLDIIAEVARADCALPATVTIAINAHSETETQQFLAQLPGDAIEGWLTGALSEENLAAQAHYRQTTGTTSTRP